jgi:hypothetical protein
MESQPPRNAGLWSTNDISDRRLIKRFPFSIYYRLIGPTVVVVAIAHHKRHPDYWRRR